MTEAEIDRLEDKLGAEIVALIERTFRESRVPREIAADLLVRTLYRVMSCGDSVMPNARYRERMLDLLEKGR